MPAISLLHITVKNVSVKLEKLLRLSDFLSFHWLYTMTNHLKNNLKGLLSNQNYVTTLEGYSKVSSANDDDDRLNVDFEQQRLLE